ncbi:thioredoxin domain-containing protein [Leekyejoonella antrihumi]|uniref:Thioredoxin domain-containing protein n=1 Tax=Leekyejoonella antrihumi TaxID=1660198 RepID=A0A563E153_9MICO|nr:thioredoxin domain-containing protein [Leekyejoonella antrihumi]TWP36246.1 thioredoxin domain-containing protein [Leekyejoonella antrihumi]
MANQLANSTSPYLLQHQDNPVDWWEWCDDAFAEARRRGVPVFLSIGYAACHWCHVMAHQSFEDETVAAAINADFVAIKVDREERPDIDAVYMNATTAMTGQGGWPMTCLLTPAGEPFFAGTYLPKPQLLGLLQAAHQTWTEQQSTVLDSASHIVQQLQDIGSTTAAATTFDAAQLDHAVARLQTTYDSVNGGFGTSPKFPPSMVLELLLRQYARTGAAGALEMVEGTCEAMARGGIYDQLAGGFARYSVDAGWVVPHFEKMLYDNAQLLRVYAHWWRVSGSALAARIARETADFIRVQLGTAEGGFASALDADTDGVEGLTYAWTPSQLREVLGDEEGARAADLLSVTPEGSFEHGSSTLQLRTDPDDPAWWQGVRTRLLGARDQRPQPARDDKVVTSWNGLAVAALADAGTILDEPQWVADAVRCATFLMEHHLAGGRLRRTSRDGRIGSAAGVSDDYGNLAEGLLALHQATADPSWLGAAQGLLDTAIEHFIADDGGFFDTADDAEELFSRPRGRGDNAEPSGTAALAGALLTCSALTGDTRYRDVADRALAAMTHTADRDPRFAGWGLAVAEASIVGPLQVAIVGDATGGLTRVATGSSSPGLVLVSGMPDADGVPLLAERPLAGGEPTAYVCRGFVCDAPVTDPEALADQLSLP